MLFDGDALPDPAETPVLHNFGLVRSNELPNIAVRWLVADLVDRESVRMLAGHDAHDPWGLEQLPMGSVSEAHLTVPSSPDQQRRIAVVWGDHEMAGGGATSTAPPAALTVP